MDRIAETSSQVIVTLSGDGDRIYLRGDDLGAEDITFVTEGCDFA